MIVNSYIDRKGALTDKYYEDKANGEVKVAEEVADSAASVLDTEKARNPKYGFLASD